MADTMPGRPWIGQRRADVLMFSVIDRSRSTRGNTMNTFESPLTELAANAAAYDDARFLARQTIKSIRVGTVSEGQAMDALATCRNELDNTTADIWKYLRGLDMDPSHVLGSIEYRMTEDAGISARAAVDELSHVIARDF